MNCNNGKRFVSFFDILGFKSWIEVDGSKEVFKYVKGYLDMMIKSSLPNAIVNSDMSVEFEVQNVDFVYFSDSIIFYSKDDTEESFKALITASNTFMNVFNCGVSYMLRGAMAYGEFYADDETRSYVGQALIDAYQLEEETNWLGFSFHSSVLETNVFQNFFENNQHLIFKSLIPTTKTNDYPFALNWADNSRCENGDYYQLNSKYFRINEGISFNVYKSLQDCLIRRKKELELKPDELRKVEIRISNTLDFIRFCENKIKTLK